MESTTKKKLGTAGAGVAAVGAAVALTAGTFSYFSDTQSDDVRASTGSLTIGQSYEGDTDFGNLAPGDSLGGTYTLTNDGSVAGDLTVGLEDHGGSSSLKDALEVDVDGVGQGTLAQFEDNGPKDFGTLKPDEDETFEITVTFPDEGNQNNLQDKHADVRLKAELNQPG